MSWWGGAGWSLPDDLRSHCCWDWRERWSGARLRCPGSQGLGRDAARGRKSDRPGEPGCGPAVVAGAAAGVAAGDTAAVAGAAPASTAVAGRERAARSGSVPQDPRGRLPRSALLRNEHAAARTPLALCQLRCRRSEPVPALDLALEGLQGEWGRSDTMAAAGSHAAAVAVAGCRVRGAAAAAVAEAELAAAAAAAAEHTAAGAGSDDSPCCSCAAGQQTDTVRSCPSPPAAQAQAQAHSWQC